jgi:hypothetical protein
MRCFIPRNEKVRGAFFATAIGSIAAVAAGLNRGSARGFVGNVMQVADILRFRWPVGSYYIICDVITRPEA